MESLKETRGERFIDSVKKCKKPIIILKAGKSKIGKKAAATHTASLASEEGVYSGIFKQLGIIEATSVKELFRTAKIIERYGQIGKRGLIVTNAGGLGVLTSDYCELYGINATTIPKKLERKIIEAIPYNSRIENPLDILGDADEKDYKKTLERLDPMKFFDFFIVLLTPQESVNPEAVAEILGKLSKPTFACFIGGDKIAKAKNALIKNKTPFFDEPEELCKTIGKVIYTN
jgi:acyl-CoA synthetase (NDP forming)